MSDDSFFSIERKFRAHAALCTTGFLILLPIGALIARLGRNLTDRWFYVHFAFQFFIAAPIIFTGWGLGRAGVLEFGTGEFNDPHKKIGLALLLLYLLQLGVGFFIHYKKIPFLGGHRPPQNYFHAVLGLLIIALAGYQVHLGLTFEWNNVFGDVYPITDDLVRAWLGIVVGFWVAYVTGLTWLPTQYAKEKRNREAQRNNAPQLKPDVEG